MNGRLAIVAVIASSGCAIGAGTTTVGIWRPKRVVDTEVCIQETPGRCTRTDQVARDVPARRFAGGLFAWFNPGYMRVSGVDGARRHMFAIDSHYEYLRGRGGVALGGRIGANLAFGSKHSLITFPVTVVGHWGYTRFSLYGGPGFTPYAVHQIDMETRRPVGIHVLAGARVLLKATRSARMTTNVDVFQYFFQDVAATSATTSFSLHF